MSEFRRFYLWGLHAKYNMGLYFAALVFFVGGLSFLFGGESLRLMPLLQMLILAMVLGFFQAAILPMGNSLSTASLWLRSNLVILLAFGLTLWLAIWGKWFLGLPVWCAPLVAVLMGFGVFFTLLGQRWEQEMDTRHLQASLRTYQEGEAAE